MVNAQHLKILSVIAEALSTLDKKIEKEDSTTNLTIEAVTVSEQGIPVGHFAVSNNAWSFVPVEVEES